MAPLICLVYVDDIIVHSKDLQDNLQRLRLSFNRLLTKVLTLKVSKDGNCGLLRTEVGFFGHRISAQGLAPDPDKVEAVRDFQIPHCLRNVRAFL